MANVPVTGLTYNGKQLYYEDTGPVTPPVEPPVQPPTQTPAYVVPTQVAGRSVILSKFPWVNGAPRTIATPDNNNVWAIVFTPGPYTTMRLAGAEWQSQPTPHLFAIMRNKDGATIMTGPPEGSNSPSVTGLPGVPPPRSGKYQLEVGVTYTLSIWNKNLTAGPSKMFMEMYFQ